MNQYDEALKKETAFLGQPRGVGTLSFVQLCSSFSSYASCLYKNMLNI